MSISAALLTLFGCSSAPLPVGTFRGEHNIAVNPGTDPVVARQLRRVVLTLTEDGKVNLEDGGLPIEGLASRQGDKVGIEVLAVSGVNVARQQQVPRSLSLTIVNDDTLRLGDATLARVP